MKMMSSDHQAKLSLPGRVIDMSVAYVREWLFERVPVALVSSHMMTPHYQRTVVSFYQPNFQGLRHRCYDVLHFNEAPKRFKEFIHEYRASECQQKGEYSVLYDAVVEEYGREMHGTGLLSRHCSC